MDKSDSYHLLRTLILTLALHELRRFFAIKKSRNNPFSQGAVPRFVWVQPVPGPMNGFFGCGFSKKISCVRKLKVLLSGNILNFKADFLASCMDGTRLNGDNAFSRRNGNCRGYPLIGG